MKIFPRAFTLLFSTCFLFLFIFSLSIFGQLNYTQFSTSTANQLSFLVDSQINGNSLRLITAQNQGSKAAVWHKSKHRVTDGFVAMFNFRIFNGQGPTNHGADGLAFVVQNYSFELPGGIGGSGGNIGYGRDTNPQSPADGIPYSIAVEFDTYMNASLNDPDDNHISVHNAGQFFNSANESASIARTSSIPNLRDGNPHTVRIEYDGPTGTVPHQWRIYFDDLAAPKLTFVKILSDVLFDGGPDAWIGFTAASASEWENHEVSNWSFSPKFPENLPNFTAPDATSNITGPFSSADYHPGADANNFNPDAMIDTSVLPDRKTELWAKYYFPNNLSGGPYPLVVLLHGNHGTCGRGANPRRDDSIVYTDSGICTDTPAGNYVVTPNHTGYDYLADKLAASGYIVASINANLGINVAAGYPKPGFVDINKFPESEYSQDAYLILARARLTLRHLQRLSEWNAGVSPFITGTTFETTQGTLPSTRAWYGMKITTGNQPVKIRSLGRIYYKGNTQTHRLRIVRVSDNAIVASAQVTMTDMTHGQFKYTDLSAPVTLAANTSYHIVSEEFAGGDKFYYSDMKTLTVPVATIDSAIMSINNGGSWKNPSYKLQPYGPVNFIYEADSTTPAALGVNLKGKIDFTNVGLMGHSRGGEGVRTAYEIYEEPNSPWKTRILTPMKIKGVFEFAPTDKSIRKLNNTLIRTTNALGTAWNVVLPACDGDLWGMEGVKPFDRMLRMSAEGTESQKSVYYVYGANHNNFNAQWQISDSYRTANNPYEPTDLNSCTGRDNNPLFLNPQIIGTGYGTVSQQTVGLSSFLAFMRGNVGASANAAFKQNFDPRYNLPSNVTNITKVERSYAPSINAPRKLVLHDLDYSSGTGICSQSRIDCNSGSVTASSTKVQVHSSGPYMGEINHDEDFNAVNVSWTVPGPGTFFQANGVSSSTNVSSFQSLDFRISRRRSTTDDLMVDSLNSSDLTNFSVQLVLADGTISNAVGLSKFIRLVGPVGKTNATIGAAINLNGELHPILRSVRIPLTEFSGFDLTQIKGVRFIFNDVSKGAVNLSDINFTK